jgi:hypothetical protein
MPMLHGCAQLLTFTSTCCRARFARRAVKEPTTPRRRGQLAAADEAPTAAAQAEAHERLF